MFIRESKKFAFFQLVLSFFFATTLLIGCEHGPNSKKSDEDSELPIRYDELLFEELDSTSVLSRLYDSRKFSIANEVIWRPDIYNLINTEVSYDGNCYTRIDTILDYTNETDSLKAFLLTTSTYSSVNKREECHACSPCLDIAIFRKNDNGSGWLLIGYKRRVSYIGSYGEKDCDFRLINYGLNDVCLELKHGMDGNQGYFHATTELYDFSRPFRLNRIFEYTYSISYGGAIDVGAEPIEEVSSFELIKDSSDFYPIKLTVSRMEKIHTVNTQMYYYDVDENKYMRGN